MTLTLSKLESRVAQLQTGAIPKNAVLKELEGARERSIVERIATANPQGRANEIDLTEIRGAIQKYKASFTASAGDGSFMHAAFCIVNQFEKHGKAPDPRGRVQPTLSSARLSDPVISQALGRFPSQPLVVVHATRNFDRGNQHFTNQPGRGETAKVGIEQAISRWDRDKWPVVHLGYAEEQNYYIVPRAGHQVQRSQSGENGIVPQVPHVTVAGGHLHRCLMVAIAHMFAHYVRQHPKAPYFVVTLPTAAVYTRQYGHLYSRRFQDVARERAPSELGVLLAELSYVHHQHDESHEPGELHRYWTEGDAFDYSLTEVVPSGQYLMGFQELPQESVLARHSHSLAIVLNDEVIHLRRTRGPMLILRFVDSRP